MNFWYICKHWYLKRVPSLRLCNVTYLSWQTILLIDYCMLKFFWFNRILNYFAFLMNRFFNVSFAWKSAIKSNVKHIKFFLHILQIYFSNFYLIHQLLFFANELHNCFFFSNLYFCKSFLFLCYNSEKKIFVPIVWLVNCYIMPPHSHWENCWRLIFFSLGERFCNFSLGCQNGCIILYLSQKKKIIPLSVFFI